LAILELRALRGWSLAQTAKVFHVTPVTVGSWCDRLDEEGSTALLRTLIPVNKYPDFVRYLVQRLQLLCPRLGKVKIAQVFARWPASECDQHRSYASREPHSALFVWQTNPGLSPRGYGQVPQPPLARRSHGRADLCRILDVLDALHVAAELAVLLVVGGDPRSLLAPCPWLQMLWPAAKLGADTSFCR
jgi:hypothetical protein